MIVLFPIHDNSHKITHWNYTKHPNKMYILNTGRKVNLSLVGHIIP